MLTLIVQVLFGSIAVTVEESFPKVQPDPVIEMLIVPSFAPIDGVTVNAADSP